MAILRQPPQIQTYHCLCTSLLLASTHTLSNLPRRQSQDAAMILPLPSTPPSLTTDTLQLAPDLSPRLDNEDLPQEGYSLLLGLIPEKKVTIVRREDGFEKRVLYRCSRCRLVGGYELLNSNSNSNSQSDTEAMEIDGGEKGKGRGREGYDGKVIYLLPAGIMSTSFMMREDGKKVREEDVGIGGVGVFE